MARRGVFRVAPVIVGWSGVLGSTMKQVYGEITLIARTKIAVRTP